MGACSEHPLMEDLTHTEMSLWLANTTPALIAEGSEKFEQGKARAIYGTDKIDYTIMSYVIGDLQKHLYTWYQESNVG